MRTLVFILMVVLSVGCANSNSQSVEVSCGQCQFGMTTQDGCDLAVRIDDKAYFVDGANIDDFGDAHDEDTGFCEVIRTAEVSGDISDERFIVKSIELND